MKKNKKIILYLIIIAIIGFGAISYIFYQDIFYIFRPTLKIETIKTNRDVDNDGINDIDDIILGARKEVKNKTVYRSNYYIGGYPPEGEGVCTDVIWRAYKNAGYDLKSLVDSDIRNNLKNYLNIKTPDPNIDFRRVKNLIIFFKNNALSLTTDVKPYDKENLKQWQPGDIVFLKEHVAIVSDKRRKDGVPYIIHNASFHAKEENVLMFWNEKNEIIGHYRYPF